MTAIQTIYKSTQQLSRVLGKYATHVIQCPSMGDSITEGTVKEYMKNVGDKLESGDIVAQIETDKITVEIPCEQDGYLKKWFVPIDEVAEVGEPLFEIDDDVVEADASAQTSSPAASNHELDFLGRIIEKENMSRLRQTVASRLKGAQETAAMLTTFNEVNMKPIMDLRKKHGAAFLKKHDIKLGFMSLFMKACTKALKEFPEINCYLDESGKVIMKPKFVDISVAVASPTGLVVPVVRDCCEKSLADYESNLGELATKAREGKITMQDMQGGTFTISNGGVFGSLMGTPIINPPQSAILGMHGTHQRPVVENGQIVARPMMYLALTYDHRMVDGKEAVLFLKAIKNYVENPESMDIANDL